jgi:hypothetical protein
MTRGRFPKALTNQFTSGGAQFTVAPGASRVGRAACRVNAFTSHAGPERAQSA